jgi:hypothetical protein
MKKLILACLGLGILPFAFAQKNIKTVYYYVHPQSGTANQQVIITTKKNGDKEIKKVRNMRPTGLFKTKYVMPAMFDMHTHISETLDENMLKLMTKAGIVGT